MRAKPEILAAALAAVAVLAGCGATPKPKQAVYAITVGHTSARVEIAADPESRAKGLSGRTALAEDSGMLFFFPQAGPVSFWMKDTHVPLSIAFITPDGRIAGIQDMSPDTLDLHTSSVPVIMTLEMSSGWFTRNSVRPGDAIVLPPELSAMRAR
jgi:uncharacterized membrane protein (UPF0127 family)